MPEKRPQSDRLKSFRERAGMTIAWIALALLMAAVPFVSADGESPVRHDLASCPEGCLVGETAGGPGVIELAVAPQPRLVASSASR